MADTSADAEKLDRQREALSQTLGDVHAKLSEMESDKAEGRAASILSGLGFSPERQQYPTRTFSGGWRMRLALARALFCEPDLLLLDGKFKCPLFSIEYLYIVSRVRRLANSRCQNLPICWTCHQLLSYPTTSRATPARFW